MLSDELTNFVQQDDGLTNANDFNQILFLNLPPGDYLVEKIRDSAGQKGTGKWTAIAALDYGVPVTLIGEAVFARCLSSLQSERIEASQVLPAPTFKAYHGERASFIEAIRRVTLPKNQ